MASTSTTVTPKTAAEKTMNALDEAARFARHEIVLRLHEAEREGNAYGLDRALKDYGEALVRVRKLALVQCGDRIVARRRVYDQPGDHFGPPSAEELVKYPDAGTIHAEVGDKGTVVHVEKGVWPTVQFDRTGTATMVCPQEAEVLEET